MASKFVGVNSPGSVMKTTAGQRILGKWARVRPRKIDVETDLVRDAFYAYYLNAPKTLEQVPTLRQLNKEMLDWVMSSGAFEQSRYRTIGRMLISANSAELLAEFLIKNPPVKQAMDKANEAQKESQKAQDAQDEGDNREAEDHRNRAKELMQQALQQFRDYANTPEAGVARSNAARKTDTEAGKLESTMALWGIGEGPGTKTDFEQLEQFLAMVKDGYLEALAEKMGRAMGTALKIRKPDSKQQVVVTDAGYTRDVMNVFPTQLMSLLWEDVSEALHLKTLAEFGTHGVLGMLKTSESKESGTIVFEVDTSGSMDGGRLVLAKALAIGIGKAAEKNGQKWLGSNFGSGGEHSSPVGSESTPMEVLQFARNGFGGGTDFDLAIREGLRTISRLENPNEADLIIITDGYCGVSPASGTLLRQAKKDWGVRFMALLVDSNEYGNLKAYTDYAAVIRTNDDIAKATEGLANALWNELDDKDD